MSQADARGQAEFERAYRAYSPLILAYALRRTASTDDAADAVAETFATAWRRVADLPAGEEAKLWLYGVARRVLANHARGARRRQRLGERLRQELPRIARAASMPDSSGTQRIEEAFRRLKPADREVLSLVCWEGLKRDEVAAVMGCSPNTVSVRLHRARARLRKALAAADLQPQSLRAAGHEQPGSARVGPGTQEAR